MREQIFEVGHKSLVKEKLVALLTSELVPVSLMHYDDWVEVACHVGDWVEVACDYSPGICSEGGTGVVVATIEGEASHLPLTCI